MAKVPFGKLNLKNKENDFTSIFINDVEIEVKQYLIADKKLELISKVIDSSMESNNYFNPIKADLHFKLEMVNYYTNISFTDKQAEDFAKLYDLLDSNGVFTKVLQAIPQEEVDMIQYSITKGIDSFYAYKNSAVGIVEAISLDYSNLDLNAINIQQKLADPNNLTLVKDVLTKLG